MNDSSDAASQHKPHENLGNCRQVRDWPVVHRRRTFYRGLLQQRQHFPPNICVRLEVQRHRRLDRSPIVFSLDRAHSTQIIGASVSRRRLPTLSFSPGILVQDLASVDRFSMTLTLS